MTVQRGGLRSRVAVLLDHVAELGGRIKEASLQTPTRLRAIKAVERCKRALRDIDAELEGDDG